MSSPTKENILIIGGTSGIGLSSAEYLRMKGMSVTVAGRRSISHEQVKSKNVDLTNEDSVKELFSNIDEPLDGLVFSAGITKPKDSIEKFNQEDWNHLIQVNVTGALLCLKYAYPLLKKSKGRVVIVNSIASRLYSLFSSVEYSMSKAALSSMVKQLSIEWGADSILINSVFPSMTKTPMLEKNVEKKVIENVSGDIPLGKIASCTDVARAIYFLISRENKYMTGTGVDINGGQYLNG